jgi:hypothetical protein
MIKWKHFTWVMTPCSVAGFSPEGEADTLKMMAITYRSTTQNTTIHIFHTKRTLNLRFNHTHAILIALYHANSDNFEYICYYSPFLSKRQ